MKAPARFRPRLGQRRGEAHPFGAIIIAMLEEMFGDGHRQPCPRARRQKEQPPGTECDAKDNPRSQPAKIPAGQIGSEPCRASGCQYVELPLSTASTKKKR